jgi:hypothetical protein
MFCAPNRPGRLTYIHLATFTRDARIIRDDDSFPEEIEKLKETFKRNGYNSLVVQQGKASENNGKHNAVALIP